MLPARRLWRRRPFFRRGYLGLLCGTGVARSRGRRRSAGAQEQPVLKSYTKNIDVKIHVDITSA